MSAAEVWRRLEPLVGEWRDAGWRGARAAGGGFTVEALLGGKALLRRNVAILPELRHEDALLTYRDGDDVRALYVDTEGHVIDYRVAAWEDGVEYVSGGETRYRMRYRPVGADRLRVTFEIAPPGGAFAEHVAGEVTRLRQGGARAVP